MRAPDGSYEDGFVVPGGEKLPTRTEQPGNLERNNPLSLHDEVCPPFCLPDEFAFGKKCADRVSNLESMEGVVCNGGAAQDNRSGRGAHVSPTSTTRSPSLPFTLLDTLYRSFPDIGYFRAPAVQSQLASILFLYAVLYPHVGYRQGMHELLAPIYYAVDFDSLPDTSESDDFSELCARRWVAADAWALFDSVMSGAGQWYEWRELPQRQVRTVAGLVHLNGQGSTAPHVTPILHACNRVQGELLQSVDPVLWERLQAEGIEPQMYGMWVHSAFASLSWQIDSGAS